MASDELSDKAATPPQPAKWKITLRGGGEWSTVKYGVVEYLRKHPRMRAATATLGIVWIFGWLATVSGFKSPFLLFPTVTAMFVTPTLLWLAVVSGPEFELAFGETKTTEPQVLPPTQVKGLLDADTYGIEALNKSYVSTETYARSSFRWSLFALIAGICVGSGNVWLIMVRPELARSEHTALFIWIAATTMFLLCVVFLVRAMFLFRRASQIHDKLLELQKAITAIKLLDGKVVPVESDTGLVIKNLLGSSAAAPN
jgi:hypothetical protein